MIPDFPTFKKLELADREIVRTYTHQYPYSDFNFVSMWSWNVHEQMALSIHKGNLAVRFTDYQTGDPFYSFIGNQNIESTTRDLITYSAENGCPPEIRLLPAEIAEQLNTDLFTVLADLDHTDYILCTKKLSQLPGAELAGKRREVSRFIRLHDDFQFTQLDLKNPDCIAQIRALFKRWLSQKNLVGTVDGEHEYRAFERCIKLAEVHSVLVLGVLVKNSLAGFWLIEDLENTYAISHFEKADITTYPGIFPYLKQKTGEFLHARGIEFMNLEQDLGILGLRISKNSYFPQKLLMKYRVACK